MSLGSKDVGEMNSIRTRRPAPFRRQRLVVGAVVGLVVEDLTGDDVGAVAKASSSETASLFDTMTDLLRLLRAL